MNRFLQMVLGAAVTAFVAAQPAMAAEQHVLDQDADAALKSLYSNHSGAKALGDKAIGILVFPSVTKAGFILGAQGGDGVLFEKGKITGHFNTGALSVGLQAGVQSYGYALFFMTPEDLAYLKKASGWALGVGPSIVVAGAGLGRGGFTRPGPTDAHSC